MEESILLDLFGIIAIGLLVGANGFFVAAEFSLVSVRRTRIAELITQGNIAAEDVQKAIDDPDRVIAATQLGITLSSLALGWVGEPALAHLIYPIVSLFPSSLRSEISHSISSVIAFSLITFLHVVVGELAPKSIALQDPEHTSLIVARPTLITEKIFKPVIWALNGTGNALLKFFGVEPATGHHLVHSIEELKMLVTASTQGGVVEEEEREMLHAVFDMGEMMVRHVMIPRTEIAAAEADTPIREVINLVSEKTYTKIPVYEDNLDQIIGVVHVKDLLIAIRDIESRTLYARDFLREPIFVPETLTVSGLLRVFRDKRQHIAIVMDEFSGTAGLVTLEDLLEEIVGEVSDPFDRIKPDFQMLPDGSVLIDGLTQIEDVNERLGLELVEPNYDTIAGYMLGKLGRIPAMHDVVEGSGVRLRVEELEGMRIVRVSLVKVEAPLAQLSESDINNEKYPSEDHS